VVVCVEKGNCETEIIIKSHMTEKGQKEHNNKSGKERKSIVKEMTYADAVCRKNREKENKLVDQKNEFFHTHSF
jgi:hypothetical protein